MQKFLFIKSLILLTDICYAADITVVPSIYKTMGTAQMVIKYF